MYSYRTTYRHRHAGWRFALQAHHPNLTLTLILTRTEWSDQCLDAVACEGSYSRLIRPTRMLCLERLSVHSVGSGCCGLERLVGWPFALRAHGRPLDPNPNPNSNPNAMGWPLLGCCGLSRLYNRLIRPTWMQCMEILLILIAWFGPVSYTHLTLPTICSV